MLGQLGVKVPLCTLGMKFEKGKLAEICQLIMDKYLPYNKYTLTHIYTYIYIYIYILNVPQKKSIRNYMGKKDLYYAFVFEENDANMHVYLNKATFPIPHPTLN